MYLLNRYIRKLVYFLNSKLFVLANLQKYMYFWNWINVFTGISNDLVEFAFVILSISPALLKHKFPTQFWWFFTSYVLVLVCIRMGFLKLDSRKY